MTSFHPEKSLEFVQTQGAKGLIEYQGQQDEDEARGRFEVSVIAQSDQGIYTIVLPEGAAKDASESPSPWASITVKHDSVPPKLPTFTSSLDPHRRSKLRVFKVSIFADYIILLTVRLFPRANRVRTIPILLCGMISQVLIQFNEPINMSKVPSLIGIFNVTYNKSIRGYISAETVSEDPVSIWEVTFESLRGEGVIKLSLPEGAVEDLAGNLAPGGEIDLIRDTTPPLDSRWKPRGPIHTSVEYVKIAIEFGEPVIGFGLSSLEVRSSVGVSGRPMNLVKRTQSLAQLTAFGSFLCNTKFMSELITHSVW